MDEQNEFRRTVMGDVSELARICADVHMDTKERLSAARDLLDLKAQLDFCMRKAKSMGHRVKVKLDVNDITVNCYLDVFEAVRLVDLLHSKELR
jgi:hypothetical protein